MPGKSILDTDILSEYLKGHDTVVAAKAARYAKEHGVFTFTSVTVHEIVYGLELKDALRQMSKVRDWFNQKCSLQWRLITSLQPVSGRRLASGDLSWSCPTLSLRQWLQDSGIPS